MPAVPHKDAMEAADPRERFLQSTLAEAKREMHAAGGPEPLLATFLLSAIGALGISCGFAMAIDRRSLRPTLVSRDMPEAEIRPLRESAPQILGRYFTDNVREDTPLAHEVTVVAAEEMRVDPYCPTRIQLLIRWSGDSGYSGLAGFGPKLLDRPFDEREIRFLSDLSANLLAALDQLRCAAARRELTAALTEKDLALAAAQEASARTRKMLNRRIFHLNRLNEMSRELSGLRQPEQILNTFLMMLLGTFCMQAGYVLLINRKDGSGWMASRGIQPKTAAPLGPEEAGPVLRSLADTGLLKGLPAKGARIVTDTRLLSHPLCPTPMETGLVFAVDQDWVGLGAIGNRLDSAPDAEADLELLLALATPLMGVMENSRFFETIQALNTALEQQNLALQQTLSDLRVSRQRVEVLERAKEGVRTLLKREMARSDRIHPLDILVVVLIGIGLGIAYNFANPAGIALLPASWSRPPLTRISLLPARARIQADTAVLIDARPAEFFNQQHIPGAVNLPLSLFDFIYMMKFSTLDPERQIIVYGRNISRHYDEEVAAKLVNRGHRQVFILEGGLAGWEKNGYPTRRTAVK